MKTHFTWSIERNGKCPTCNVATILVVAKIWDTDNQGDEDVLKEPPVSEVSAHQCPECNQFCSLSLNTM